MTSCKLLPINLARLVAHNKPSLAAHVFVVQIHVLLPCYLLQTPNISGRQFSFLFSHAHRRPFPSHTAAVFASPAVVTFCPTQSGCTCFSRRSHLICHRRRRKMTVTFWYLEKPPPPLVSGVISFPFPHFFFTFFPPLIYWLVDQINRYQWRQQVKKKQTNKTNELNVCRSLSTDTGILIHPIRAHTHTHTLMSLVHSFCNILHRRRHSLPRGAVTHVRLWSEVSVASCSSTASIKLRLWLFPSWCFCHSDADRRLFPPYCLIEQRWF